MSSADTCPSRNVQRDYDANDRRSYPRSVDPQWAVGVCSSLKVETFEVKDCCSIDIKELTQFTIDGVPAGLSYIIDQYFVEEHKEQSECNEATTE